MQTGQKHMCIWPYDQDPGSINLQNSYTLHHWLIHIIVLIPAGSPSVHLPDPAPG